MEFGPFRGVSRLGAGAVGEVWRAVHESSGDEVAVKRLHPEHGARWRSLLRREVEAVARLDHPGIVWIVDHGVGDDGAPWVALELASGGALDSHQPPGWSTVRDWLDELLPALQHAHARGVLHRDLKPANVLLCTLDDARPGPKLCDFGLSTVAGVQGPRGGTPDYLAPEQREGRFADEGPWTDLYALGGVAWTLVCGGPPTTTPWSPRFPVPSDLREWVARLRADAVSARFPTAVAAREALRRLERISEGRAPSRTFDGLDDDRPARRHPKRMPASLALLGLRSVPLVGRNEERSLLSGVLRGLVAADPAAPRAVRLLGGPGVGKSALLRWLTTTAREQDAVDVLPWSPSGDAVARALRSFALRPGGVGVADERALTDEPLAALLTWVTTAERPVLVIADDWDARDLQLLRAAVALRPGRLAVVAAARAGEPLPGVRDVGVGPHPDPGALAKALGVGDPGLLEALARASVGNPGGVVARVRDLASRGDLVEGTAGWSLRPGAAVPSGEDLADLIPEGDRAALSVLALLDGVATESEWLAACARVGIVLAPGTVERFRRAGTIVAGPRLADAALREALVRRGEASPDQVRAAAEVLHEPGAPETWRSSERAEQAGWLRWLAGEPARAAELLAFAGRLEPDTEARRHLMLDLAEAAADALPPERREEVLWRVRHNRAGHWSNHGHHARAVELSDAFPDLTPRGRLNHASILLRAGYPHRALQIAREVVDAFPPDQRRAYLARLELARCLIEVGYTEEARPLLRDADPLSRYLLSICCVVDGDPAAGLAVLSTLDEPPTLELRALIELERLGCRVELRQAAWDEVEEAWTSPWSVASAHVRVGLAVVRVLAAAWHRPEEVARAEADLREALAENPIRTIALRRLLDLAVTASSGELARRIADLAAGQLPLDGPD